MGRYENPSEIFGWALPIIMPSLSLIITVLGASAFGPAEKQEVRRSFFGLALWLSVIYLVLVPGTILIEPFTPQQEGQDGSLLRISSLWLGPLQGLVASAMGVLFFTKQPASGE